MFGNTVQNDLALVEQIKMIVNYLRGLVLVIVILFLLVLLSVSVPRVPTGSIYYSFTIGVGTPGIAGSSTVQSPFTRPWSNIVVLLAVPVGIVV